MTDLLLFVLGVALGLAVMWLRTKDHAAGVAFNWAQAARELGMYAVAMVVILATFWVLSKVLSVEIPSGNRDIVMTIVGVLIAKFGTIVDWFFGSSKGSADKTAAMADQAKP